MEVSGYAGNDGSLHRDWSITTRRAICMQIVGCGLAIRIQARRNVAPSLPRPSLRRYKSGLPMDLNAKRPPEIEMRWSATCR